MSPLAGFGFDQHPRERISESTSVSGPDNGFVQTSSEGTAK
jgi:hypothetical protein